MRVAIIGGGAIGSAVALFLKRLGGAAVEVTVIEPDPTLRLASSARSAASLRQQFSNAVNVHMSQFGLDMITHADEWLAIDGQTPDLGFVESGYLFLATTPSGAATLRANHQVQRAAQACVDLLDGPALARRCPWLNGDDVLLASLGTAGEGWFDGEALARALQRKARALGTQWRVARVVGLVGSDPSDGALRAAQLDNGQTLQADVFVNAAGPWAGAVGRLAGLTVPVHARRRTVFAFDCPVTLPRTPLVVDPSGCWFRSEGGGFIGGWSPGAGDNDPDDLPLDQPDLAQFENRLWPALALRVPAFSALRRRSAWDGYYEVHPLDHNALIGPHPQCANLIIAAGFSGHGLQHAAAAGRGVAEWILHQRYLSLDLSAFGLQRVTDRRAFVEQAII